MAVLVFDAAFGFLQQGRARAVDLNADHLAACGLDSSGNPVGDPTTVAVEGIDLGVIQQYLREVVARGGSPSTTRSYAYDFLRWWRWLMAIGVQWDPATSTEVKDYVLWLRCGGAGEYGPALARRPDTPARLR